MASTQRVGLASALIILIVVSLSFEAVIIPADARILYEHARQLATNCNSPIARDIPGCGGGSGSGGSSRPRPSGPAPGSSRCKTGRCCGTNKMGQCVCCE